MHTRVCDLRWLLIAILTAASAASSIHADQVKWSSDIEGSLKTANESGKLVLMKFTADWCGYCKKMDREVFTQPNLAGLVNTQFVPVLVDADQHKALVEHLKIEGLPSLLVVSPEMVILDRYTGYLTEEKLLPKLQQILVAQQQAGNVKIQTASTSGAPKPTTVPVSNPGAVPPVANAQTANPQTANSDPTAAPTPAFGGLCLPAVKETRSLIQGVPKHAVKYRGKLLFFSSDDYLKKFQADPSQYWPMQDGACPVQLLQNEEVIEGRLEYAALFRGKLWVMSSEQDMQTFVAKPAHFADAITAPNNR